MSIVQSNNSYELICDCCDEVIAYGDTFGECVEKKEDYGIKSVFEGLDWYDVCLDCQD